MSYASVRRRRAARAKRKPPTKHHDWEGRYARLNGDPDYRALDGSLVRIHLVYDMPECDDSDDDCQNGWCGHGEEIPTALVRLVAPPRGIKRDTWELATMFNQVFCVYLSALQFRKRSATSKIDRTNVAALLNEVGL